MKTFLSILITGVIVAAFIAGFFYGRFKPSVPVPQQLTLEKILSIKELHLVKHVYTDLFFMHKQNNPNKAIRAIVQVPVIVTAYIDLKEIQMLKQGDTITQIVLPRARMNEPQYQVNKMIIRETRSFQVYAGKDLYPLVGSYLQATIANRIDTVRHMAVTNRVLAQAEVEGKEYILSLLRELGRSDVIVRFVDEEVTPVPMPVQYSKAAKSFSLERNKIVESTPFGFLPLQ